MRAVSLKLYSYLACIHGNFHLTSRYNNGTVGGEALSQAEICIVCVGRRRVRGLQSRRMDEVVLPLPSCLKFMQEISSHLAGAGGKN